MSKSCTKLTRNGWKSPPSVSWLAMLMTTVQTHIGCMIQCLAWYGWPMMFIGPTGMYQPCQNATDFHQRWHNERQPTHWHGWRWQSSHVHFPFDTTKQLYWKWPPHLWSGEESGHTLYNCSYATYHDTYAYATLQCREEYRSHHYTIQQQANSF